MLSEPQALEAKARELATAVADRPDAARALRLADRLAAGRFVVAVAGEFKRGKSTLLNALIGEAVLPTGVVPVTAVATELAFGAPGVDVEYLNGTRAPVGRDELAAFVTEAGNPNNGLGVARVEVRGKWPLLAGGVVLVDTPGIGSVYEHNTTAARAALADADGAVVVLAADAPLSEHERDFVRLLAERHAPTFFVVNKADQLNVDELQEVRCFVNDVLRAELHHEPQVFAVSARAALASRLAGEPRADDAFEFDAFAYEVERFIAEDLLGARVASARRELARLGGRLREGVALERAAAARDRATLAALTERFHAEVQRQRDGLDDDRTLLDRDIARLVEDTAARLADQARQAAERAQPRLEQVASEAPRGQLATALRGAIESAVRAGFASIRDAESDRAEREWQRLAHRFRQAVQDRVNDVRRAASTLFDVPLPEVEIPAIEEERERFFFLFLHLGSSTEAVEQLASRLVPGRVARRHALQRANRELAGEFDKHVGRARWDLMQRLDAVRCRVESQMQTELDDAVTAIVEAARRAEDRRSALGADHAVGDARLSQEALLADELIALVEAQPR